jgi:ABC-type transport system involved in cytochrome bd biosynthesis fused ATPase/permease subunit
MFPYLLVSNNPSLYQGTIRFNIVLGANGEVSQDDIDNACKDANVSTICADSDLLDLRIHSKFTLRL